MRDRKFKGIRNFFALITVLVFVSCGRKEDSKLDAVAPESERVKNFYQGYAECTGEPSTVTRDIASMVFGKKLDSCPAQGLVYVTELVETNEMSGGSRSSYVKTSLGWIDSRYLKLSKVSRDIPALCIKRDNPVRFSYAYLDKNVSALLSLIGFTEGTGSCYNLMVGFKEFSAFDKHPNQKQPFGEGTFSTAAGRYQFLKSTWDEVADIQGYKSFTPQEQDAGVVYYIGVRGFKNIYDPIANKAEFSIVMDKLSYGWASLPPGRFGQAIVNLDMAWSKYQAFAR